MQKRLRTSTLLNEEKRTTIWFLWLFYSVYLIYDIFYKYILPETPWLSDPGPVNNSLDYIMYIVILALLPISFYLIKNKNPWLIKYIYFISFTLINILNEIWFYLGNEVPYSNGNIVEIVIVLFSPIFVSKRFFYLVSLGTIVKFVIVGIVIKDSLVVLPLLIVVVLAMIAYILLFRFISYVMAVRDSYDKQLEGIVKGIITTLELKDSYTRGHSERVAEYSMTLAKATGSFKDSQLKSFYYTCLLHDIGKIQIPDSILTKPGKLTSEEYEVIKTHPIVGAKAVQEVEGISENIDVIRNHHERWDGKGYPDALKGEETALLPRVTAIADAFDAMTSSRSYRKALDLDEAYKQIVEGSGSQFDPHLVDIFQKIYPEWVDYHKQYHSQD
ncbi:HD domain-containing protein [Aquibacillus halophilus]|uniref:HD domain-containing protein n=1 Tax=Aquibacillus halophilus TaxID=930132 RepID=A0A6A8DFX4_9BACI|nr:HD-GYP domain-containing protein [Aquibacillus halophilus]MRH44534.1 HD domain-containing protein [Aquibacillus halophilus]